MIVIVDTETTGFLSKTLDQGKAQARITEIAYALYDENGAIKAEASFLISGVVPPPSTIAINGIDERLLSTYGVPILAALHPLKHMLECARGLGAYNIAFDRGMLESECRQLNQDPSWLRRPRLAHVCMMESAADHLRESKWIKLSDAHQRICGVPYASTHRAADDRNAAARVFFQLRKDGAITL